MIPFVKICGICSRADLEQICALSPDAIGFVFFATSKRYVRPEQVAHWLNFIPETIKKVGVFVEPTADEVEAIARTCQLDIIQIHTTSNGWKIDRPLFQGLEIWLASKLEDGITPTLLEAVQPEPSVLLTDSFDSETIGGTGKLCDWDSAKKTKDLGKPILLAGGLNHTNIAKAISVVQPWGVDVSSGVEKEPGVKDLRKVKKFLTALRAN